MRSGIGHAGRGRGGIRPYRRYRPLPALLLIALLGVVTGFIWLKAIAASSDVNEAVRCSPPPSPPPGVTYTSVGHDALDDVAPVSPDKVSVTVLNASGARGQAAITTEALRALGFDRVADPANDPAYEERTAACRGQIRYGENGARAARTLSLVDSCVELVRDDRQDASVDFAIGSGFSDVLPRREARQVLEQLSAWSEQQGDSGGSELSEGEPSRIDEELLDAARPASC